jgi:2-haloacid dehalogenase
LLSGEVRLLKPDPRIYHRFFETHAVVPAQSVYIDDSQPNVQTATALGMHGIHFTDSTALRAELRRIGLIRN